MPDQRLLLRPGGRSRAPAVIAGAFITAVIMVVGLALVALPPGPSGPPLATWSSATLESGGAIVVERSGGVAALPGGPFLDVAALGGGELLAISAQVGLQPGGPLVRLLERGEDGWQVASSIDLDPLGNRAEGAPWLVELAADRFAVLTPQPAERATRITVVEVTLQGLRSEAVLRFDHPVDEALGADVDGDGQDELVLDTSAVDPAGPTCQSGLLTILDGRTLAPRASHVLLNERLVAAAAVDLDDVPGAELAAYATGSCPASPVSPADQRLLVLRLLDGMVLRDTGLDAEDGTIAHALPPMAVDAGGDGRPELLVRAGRGAAVTAAMGGPLVPVDTGVPLGVVPGSDGRPRILVLGGPRDRGDPAPGTLRLAAFGRADDGSPYLRHEAELFVPGSDAPLSRVRLDLLRFAGSPAGLPVRLLDLDADGCPELVIPGASWPCATGSLGASRATWAPTFLATTLLGVPVARAAAADDAATGPRRALLAVSLGWDREVRRLGAPGPAAATPLVPGAMRTPTSGSFAIVDVPAGAINAADPGFTGATLDASAIDRNRGASVVAPAGTRIVGVGVVDVVGSEPSVDTLDAFVAAYRRAPVGSEMVVVGGTATLGASRRGEVVVPGPDPIGADYPFPAFAPDGSGRDTDHGESLTVHLVGISPLGEPSAVTVVRRGTAAGTPAPAGTPALAVQAPMLSVPWPAETLVEGSTEAGSLVAVGDGPATPTVDGRFAIPARLPPWPTDFVVRTTTPAGGTSSVRVSLVGGFDYRRLPLDMAGLGLLLALAVVGVWRASGTARPRPTTPDGGASPASPNPDADWEIEELPPST
jgi:hypothetical protein